MPETDFEAIAIRLIGFPAVFIPPATLARVVAELQQIWNARGVVDIATIESQLSSLMGTTAAGPCVKNLDRALRRLDR
jgi:hypothetical protein